MRVLHLAYTFYEADTRVLRYAEALVADGHEVDVLSLRRRRDEPVEETLNGVRVTRLQPRQINERRAAAYLFKMLAFSLRSAAVMASRHRERPYDLIHVHNPPDFLVFSAWFAKRGGARVILDIHDLVPELYRDKFGKSPDHWEIRLLGAVERLSASFADHVIAANDLWLEKLTVRSVPPDRCTVLLNYPDTRLFKPARREKNPSDGFLIFYPGSLSRHQGLDVAVRAFARARPQMPGARFLICGEGPAKETLRKLASELNLNSSVDIRPEVPLARVAELMRQADLGVIPKRAEGFGDEAFSTKSLEFMACGVPVVMSRTTVDTWYFGEDLVRFFPSGDIDALAAEFVAAYRDREAAGERARRAQAFAREQSWENHLHEYLELVARLTRSA